MILLINTPKIEERKISLLHKNVIDKVFSKKKSKFEIVIHLLWLLYKYKFKEKSPKLQSVLNCSGR